MTDVAVFLLKNGTYLIAKYEELDEEPSCYLTNCYKIKNEDELEEFPQYSFERDCLLNSSELLTIFEPNEKILELYKKTIS
jgi:hypothetical protein